MPWAEFWRNRAVLVTGASGFLGRWLSSALQELNADVVGAARSRAAGRLRLDVTDAAAVERAFEAQRPLTVFHLAAQALTGVARGDPRLTLETNVRGTWNVLQAASTFGVKQVVCASSAAVYAAAPRALREEDRLGEGSFYDVSKGCADWITMTFGREQGLPTAVARFPNLYGPGDPHTSRLIPGLLQAIARGEAFEVRGDGTAERDFLHVRDAAGGLIRLAEGLEQGAAAPGEAFNFGSGRPESILSVVKLALRLAGRADLEPRVLGEAPEGFPRLWLDARKAHDRLGWAPRLSLEEGLRQTLAVERGGGALA